MTIPSLLTGFIIGAMALWIYLALAAKRRVPPPTMAKRKDAREGGNASTAEREPGVNYQWVNLTGEEQ